MMKTLRFCYISNLWNSLKIFFFASRTTCEWNIYVLDKNNSFPTLHLGSENTICCRLETISGSVLQLEETLT